jgi:hypothetical protein
MFPMQQSAPSAFSWGDTLEATYTFTGDKKGTADFVCTVVATHFLCQGIIRLPDGDIYTQTGPIDPKQPAAIVGGTRAFVGVSGQFTQRETPMTPVVPRTPAPADGRSLADCGAF